MARRALAPTHDVDVHVDGTLALERLADGAVPDAIVLDWELPGLSGLEVCNTIRATHDPMSLPILILTAHGLKENTVEALAAGANDYVTKPFDIAELTARVSRLVRIRRLHDEQVRRARQLALAAEVGASLTKGMRNRRNRRSFVDAIVLHLDAIAAGVWRRTLPGSRPSR